MATKATIGRITWDECDGCICKTPAGCNLTEAEFSAAVRVEIIAHRAWVVCNLYEPGADDER